MGFRLVALLLVLALFSISTLGCGLLGFGGDGDSEDSLELDMIQFSDDLPEPEEAAEAAEAEVALALSIDPDILVEIHFLYNFQVRLEGLRQMVRDLQSMLDYSGPGDIDLDWVAEVHEVTRESDDYFKVLTSLNVPVSQRGAVPVPLHCDVGEHQGVGLRCRPAAGRGGDRWPFGAFHAEHVGGGD